MKDIYEGTERSELDLKMEGNREDKGVIIYIQGKKIRTRENKAKRLR